MRLSIEKINIEIKRIVIKLGTKQLTDLNGINFKNIRKIVDEVVLLRKKGVECILTVSGAIALGMLENKENKSMALRSEENPDIDIRFDDKARLQPGYDLFSFNTGAEYSYLERNISIFISTSTSGGSFFHPEKIKDIFREYSRLTIPQKQAIASVGQVKLMDIFKKEFDRYNITVGQVLLTHNIFENRNAHLNARNTLNSIIKMGAVPIINENDSVAVDEIKFGDNDRLGALVTLLIDADLYIILSDIDGFYTDYKNIDNRRLQKVVNIDERPEIYAHADKRSNNYTSGGMETKLEAARMTNLSCIPLVIANGFKDNILDQILDGLKEGTLFTSNKCNLNFKKRWISGRKIRGVIIVDTGAAKAIRNHKSLLASGIKKVEGEFYEGDNILIRDETGNDTATGISNYSSKEVTLIAGKKSADIEKILNRGIKYNHIVHIDNMVIL